MGRRAWPTGVSDELGVVRHTLYEDPITHKFAFVRLPEEFVEGEKLSIPPTARWFSTREEAVASLPDLLNQDE
jgi:hypothetical protein